MKKFKCTICGYVYSEEAGDPDQGIRTRTKWERLPKDFQCPFCEVGKEDFEEKID